MLGFRQLPGFGFRTDVEADDNRVRGAGQKDIALGDSTGSRQDDFHFHLFVGSLDQAVADSLDGTEDVSLEDDVKLLDRAGLDLREQVVQGDLRARYSRRGSRL